MLPLLAGIAGLALLGNPFKAKRRSAKRKRRRNPPRDPRFAGAFKGDVPKGPIAGVHPLIDGDTAAVEGPRGWESWIFGPEIGPRGYREVWQFAAKHPSERAAVEHAKEMVWGPIKRNPGNGGLLTPAMLARAKQQAKDSGFKVGDEVVVRASGTRGVIKYNYNYIGEFGVLRTSGKHAGSMAHLSCRELSHAKRTNPGGDVERAVVRAAISAILNARKAPSFDRIKRTVPGLTKAEYAQALAKTRR